MPDVISIGSAFVDYFFKSSPKLLAKLALKNDNELVSNKKNLTVQQIIDNSPILRQSPGSMPINTTAVLAKIGLNAAFYGTIGIDPAGDYLLENLPFIDQSHIIRHGQTPVCACIITHQGKDRCFIPESYPNSYFFKHLDYNYLNEAKMVYIAPFLPDKQAGIDQTKKIISQLTQPKIAFTPSLYYLRFGLETLIPIIQKTNLLFLNESEIKLLTGLEPKPAATHLLSHGAQVVICTMGDRGALVTSADVQFLEPSIKIKKIIDTTGAGDTFAAGFIYGYLKGESLKKCAKIATQLSSLAIQDYGLHWLHHLDQNTLRDQKANA